MGDIQSNLFKITGRSEAMFAQLVDIKGKFCLHVRVRILSVVNARSILLLKLRKAEGNRGVGGFPMTDCVTNVVSKCPNGKREFVWCFRVVQQSENKVSRAHVMREIGKECIAKGIIAKILNGATAVSVGVSLTQLSLSKRWEALQQQRTDRFFPGQVNEFFVALEREGES